MSRWRPEALTTEEEDVMRMVASGQLERFWDGAAGCFRRRMQPGVIEAANEDSLVELQRMGYVDWVPFTESERVVRVELTDRGQEWLRRQQT